ncbi:MAG: glycosyltransferase [Deltaproteobacteria bacterium]|nr:glycosyltransferase [Deltaproteobacteria bacterium]
MAASAKPKVLYLLHAYFNKGGTEQHTRHLEAGLANSFDITIAAPHLNEIVLLKDGTVRQKYQSQMVPWPVTPLNWEVAEEALQKIVTAVKPDLVHVQHFFNWPLASIDYLSTLGVPSVLSLHDYYLISPYYTLEGAAESASRSIKACVETFGCDITLYLQTRVEYLRECLQQFSKIICPSMFLTEKLRPYFDLDFQVIEHGIPPFREKVARPESSKLRFGYVGALLPQKGWQICAEAFKELKRERPDIELHIFGGGHPDEEEKLKSDSALIFHGAYESKDLPEICSKIDVAVIPSIFAETYSLVLSEMWEGGVQVAASGIGTLGERIIDKKNGRHFTAGDKDSLKSVLRWFAENSEWRKWEVERPKALEKMIAEYRALYLDLLSN